MTAGYSSIRVNALRLIQRKDVPIFAFGVDGRVVLQFAALDFARRSKKGELSGYQRPRVSAHVKEILTYLSDAGAILPNAIVVALGGEAVFTAHPGTMPSAWGTLGMLEIPIPTKLGGKKIAWIVDGQQRAAALAQLPVARKFPVVVVGFQGTSTVLQREQFILVNKTKPLPRDLVNELLPGTSVPLPRSLGLRRVGSSVVELLRYRPTSPFFERFRGVGNDGGDGRNISQAAILSVIVTSIRKGILFELWNAEMQHHDIEGMADIMEVFYDGVRRTWPDAWEGSPKTSRLVHGVGLVALGYVMERVMAEVPYSSPRAVTMVSHRLARLEGGVAWTEDAAWWPGLECEWNALENTSRDKQRLASHLLSLYRSG